MLALVPSVRVIPPSFLYVDPSISRYLLGSTTVATSQATLLSPAFICKHLSDGLLVEPPFIRSIKDRILLLTSFASCLCVCSRLGIFVLILVLLTSDCC